VERLSGSESEHILSNDSQCGFNPFRLWRRGSEVSGQFDVFSDTATAVLCEFSGTLLSQKTLQVLGDLVAGAGWAEQVHLHSTLPQEYEACAAFEHS